MRVDDHLARQWLSNVSYYRLSAYWYPARAPTPKGCRGDTFAKGTDFTHVVDLYEADRKLRTVVHDGMERIETSMRTRVGEELYNNGPLGYCNPAAFRPEFDHNRWLDTANKRVARASRHNAVIQHHQKKYGGNYPFWVLAEVLDLSDISQLYEGLPLTSQQRIAQSLKVHPDLASLPKSQRKKAARTPPLVRWMEQITIVRNTCAHHGRLWNRSFVPAPSSALRTIPGLQDLPQGQSERAFGAVVLMAHLLRTISPGTTWPDRVDRLLTESFMPNPLVQATSLGAPTDWHGGL